MMLSYYCIVLLGLLFSGLCGMENKNCQLDFCPTRKVYYQQRAVISQNKDQKCFFCDQESLKTNYILREDIQNDVRLMMNKNPYPDFDQAIHLLIMPMSHKEHPSEFSQKELIGQVNAVQDLSEKLYADAYTQEYFTSWGKMAGQSVPHWHSHFKNYIMPPLSMPERMRQCKNYSINNVEQAFERTKILLESPKVGQQPLLEISHNGGACVSCLVNNTQTHDEENFVVARFKHNYVCLAHRPSYPGEIVVIPNRHVGAIKDLLQGELSENIALTMALFPRMKEYAHAHIRDCDGGNIYTKSIGGKASIDQQRNHHVYTVIMPRTTITLVPSAMDHNSCKLDYDPAHLFAYLKEKIDEIKFMLMQD